MAKKMTKREYRVRRKRQVIDDTMLKRSGVMNSCQKGTMAIDMRAQVVNSKKVPCIIVSELDQTCLPEKVCFTHPQLHLICVAFLISVIKALAKMMSTKSAILPRAIRKFTVLYPTN